MRSYTSIMRHSICACVFITYLLDVCSSLPGAMLGPGRIIFKSFEHTDPPVTDLDVWMTQRKYNRSTNVLDITVTTPWPLGTEITVELILDVKKEGGYKPGSFYVKDTFCALMETMLKEIFLAFLEVAGVEDCPLKAGTYKITDFRLDENKMPDQMLYGDYRMLANLMYEGVIKGSYYVYLDVLPRDQ